MSTSGSATALPKWLKYYLLSVLTIFLFGYFSFVLIEKMSMIDAFYFLIVTVTTVGFGDITPETGIGKIIVSVLIIISISSIALLSEQIVNRIVEINTQKYLELAEKLDYSNHIVICGFTKIAENIAELFQGRFFRIIILDPHAVAVERARDYGLDAYLANPQRHEVLSQVNIQEAMALYLFMDDENSNVLTSLQARMLAGEDLLIYASTEHELSIELGNLIGIDRTYHYERIVASNIRFSLRKIVAFSLPNQLLSPRARFVQVLVRQEFDFRSRFPTYYPVGFMDKTLTHFKPVEEVDDLDAELERGSLLMISVPRELAEQEMDKMIGNTPVIGEATTAIDRVIIGGYNDTARHVVEELDASIIENNEFSILCFTTAEMELARNDGYDVLFPNRTELKELLGQVATDTTLIVNLFDRLTDSLLVNTVADQIDQQISIIQLAHNRIETDVLIKSGVDRILIPDVLMSRGMFLILLSTKKLMNSMIWGNVHIFEHHLDEHSPLVGKTIKDLSKLGYFPLLYKNKSGEVVEHVGDIRLHEGGNILLFREHRILKARDQLIDPTHG